MDLVLESYAHNLRFILVNYLIIVYAMGAMLQNRSNFIVGTVKNVIWNILLNTAAFD